MTLLADPRLRDCSCGMQLELSWSKDESLATLYVAIKDQYGKERIHKIKLTPLQLDELRGFIADNIQ